MLTIIIPTMNRSDFLIRLLNYYVKENLPYLISVGDSSDSFHSGRIQNALQQLSGKLNVIYRKYPSLTEPQTTSQMLKEVATPYLAHLPDDDFITPHGLSSCLKFLEEHRDYSVALGRGLLFVLDRSGPYGKILSIGTYPLRSVESERASERLLNHLLNYSNPNFGVHRTDEFREAYRDVDKIEEKAFTEIMPNCLSCIQGKVKQLDCLYLIRHGHDRRYLMSDFFEIITSSHWASSYQIFKDRIAQELIRVDRINLEDAKKVVKRAFWGYVSKALSLRYKLKYGKKKHKQSINLTHKQQNRIDSSVKGRQVDFSINKFLRLKIRFRSYLAFNSLLNPVSRYYKDFMPVYKAIGNSKE